MTLPVFTVGQVLTAADVNAYLVNTVAARKTANESVTSSTVLQDDDHLTVTVVANAVYEVTCRLAFEGATAGDFKWQFVAPASATFSFTALTLDQAATADTNDKTIIGNLATAQGAGTLGAGTGSGCLIHGVLAVAGTAGTFKLQWAQNTSSGTATILYADSFLVLRQIL